jgi:hypothetical protein
MVEGSVLKYRVPPLWSTYIGERRGAIENSLGNMSGTWELFTMTYVPFIYPFQNNYLPSMVKLNSILTGK